jgi:hypothetical protein
MAQKIVEYVLLSNDVADRLAADVNAKLNEGWSLYGSPMCWAAPNQEFTWSDWKAYQAMVKYETT